MIKHYNGFIVVLMLILCFSCNKAMDNDSITDKLTDNPYLKFNETPKILNIIKDSLIAIPTKGIWVNPDSVSQVQRINFKMPALDLGSGKKPERKVSYFIGTIDYSRLSKNIPGRDNFSLPEKYDIPESGNVKNKRGQTIYSPIIITKRESVPKKALPPVYKENAINNIQYFDEYNGMGSSSVLSMLLDSKGILWIGTLQGLVSYDGIYFRLYTTENGLINNVVSTIFEDSRGNIWLGTSGGAACYDGASFSHYTKAQGLSDNEINAIVEDKNGNLWFGTKNGANFFKDKSIINYFTNQGLSSNEIGSIIMDKEGNIWFGTSNGLSCFDGEGFVNFSSANDFGNNSISALFQDKKGKIWFGTWEGGLSCYDGKNIYTYGSDWGLDNMIILSIKEDLNGKLWMGTFGEGVINFDGTNFNNFTSEQGLSHNSVNAITTDKSGTLWFGTLAGVSIYKENSFVYYNHYKSQSNNILSINADVNGHLLSGTSDGVYAFTGSTVVKMDLDKAVGDIGSIYSDKSGKFWLGTETGIYSYDGKSLLSYGTKQGLVNNWVSTIIEDNKGLLWIGTWSGLSCFNGQSFRNFTVKEGLAGNSVSSVFEDDSGKLWIATMGGGISCLYNDVFINYNTSNSQISNKITAINQDSKGNLWFGTYGQGLLRFDGHSFMHFKEEQGLCNNFVESLMFDIKNQLWIATQNGLSCLVISEKDSTERSKKNNELTENFSFYNFGLQDGIKSMKFGLNAVCLDKENIIRWGSAEGILMLDLNKFSLPDMAPELYLNTVEILKQYTDYRQFNDEVTAEKLAGKLEGIIRHKIKFSDVANFNNYPIGLELPYDLNQLSFDFSAIDWNAPHKLRYQYKLEGQDNYWSPVSQENIAEYKNIPSGRYILKVKAIGASKKWSKVLEYPFVIHPPWWLSWWAWTFYVVIFILILGTYIRLRMAGLKQSKKILEQKVKERTREVETQKAALQEQNEEIMAQRDLLSQQNNAINESIQYAKHLQIAVMPAREYTDQILDDYFILFKPRDIVSGDFYWLRKINHYVIVVVADCTGHGIPGALMSMLGISFINEIVQQREITKPNLVLNELRERVKDALKQTGEIGEADDGMDLAFCVLDTETKVLQYAGANNSIYLVVDSQFKEIKADKMPIGYYLGEKASFTNHEIQLQKGDTFYLFSDGFMDQFGGKLGLKFKASDFQQLIIENHKKPLGVQHGIYEQALHDWMNGNQQTDDILVMGVKV